MGAERNNSGARRGKSNASARMEGRGRAGCKLIGLAAGVMKEGWQGKWEFYIKSNSCRLRGGMGHAPAQAKGLAGRRNTCA